MKSITCNVMLCEVGSIFYTNSYPLYLKLMKDFRRGESLADAIAEGLYMRFPDLQENLYESSGLVLRGYFEKEPSYYCNILRSKIRQIYTEGYHKTLNIQNDVIFEEVYYEQYYYSFISQSNEMGRKYIILLNFYGKEEMNTEDKLFTGTVENPFIESNKINWCRGPKGEIVINTYNAFCAYAHYENKKADWKLNSPFFKEILENLNVHNEYVNAPHTFKYITYDNLIIVVETDTARGE